MAFSLYRRGTPYRDSLDTECVLSIEDMYSPPAMETLPPPSPSKVFPGKYLSSIQRATFKFAKKQKLWENLCFLYTECVRSMWNVISLYRMCSLYRISVSLQMFSILDTSIRWRWKTELTKLNWAKLTKLNCDMVSALGHTFDVEDLLRISGRKRIASTNSFFFI
jgi:hypothetical protein